MNKCVVCNTQVNDDGCEYIELLDKAAFIRDHTVIRVRISYTCSPKCFRVFLTYRGEVRFSQNSVIQTLKESP